MGKMLPFRLPAPPEGEVDLLVVAGEHSGDQHAAVMVRELLEKNPGMRISAFGGPALEATGVQLLYDLAESSVVGIVEVLKHFSFFKMLFEETLRWIEEYRPKAVLFVDYPGFNLRIAAKLYKKGLAAKAGGNVKLLYYISPQIWAWKAKRRFKMAKVLDALAVIFPFEVDCYKDTELKVEFVGHPFLGGSHVAPVKYNPEGPLLLLPGSRRQAVSRIFPVLIEAFKAYGKREAVVLYPTEEIKEVLLSAAPPEGIRLEKIGGVVEAAAVLTSSGTMQMHCALAAIPGAITYKISTLTYWFARMVLKIGFLGISNILLKEPMYPEYVQKAATAEALSKEIVDCLDNPKRLERTREQAVRLMEILKQPTGGSVADWVLRQMR